MRFWVDVGGGAHLIDADDADEAAEKAAEKDHDESGEPQQEYDATVLAPDGTVTRHEVHVDYSPNFSAYPHNDKPQAETEADLRLCAAEDA